MFTHRSQLGADRGSLLAVSFNSIAVYSYPASSSAAWAFWQKGQVEKENIISVYILAGLAG